MADGIDLSYAFELDPEEAMAYFRAKGYAISWDWWEVWERAHAVAFTVAKVMRQDLLADIRAAVDAAMAEGKPFREFARELTPILKKKGWWGKLTDDYGETVQLGSPWRLRTIYSVNLQTAYMAGRYATHMELTEERPYWMYTAVMDSRTRPGHAALHGLVFRYDDPIWESLYPPNGWNCRCRVRALSLHKLRQLGKTVMSSDGFLHNEEMLVSKKTGELRPVTVFEGEVQGKQIRMAPDVGWSSNAAQDYLQRKAA